MIPTEDIFESILNNIIACSPKSYLLLNKNPLATSLVEQYEVLHNDVSVRLTPNVNVLNKQQITDIIEKMLYYQYPIISMEEYYLMESFQGYFWTLGDIKKQNINALLPPTKKRRYQLEDFKACWSNNGFFYVQFKEKDKIYFIDTMQEIILPEYLHSKVLDKMLFNNRKKITEQAFRLVNPYVLSSYQYGYSGRNCKIENTGEMSYEQIESKILNNKKYFLLENPHKGTEILKRYTLCYEKVDGSFALDITDVWYEKLIAKMLATNCFILSYEDYQVVVQYDLYKKKVQLTRSYTPKQPLLTKYFKKIIGLQKLDDFRDFWESGNYFVVLEGEVHTIYHLHSLVKIETLGNFFSTILQKMLENNCLVITNSMYNTIKKYEINKLLNNLKIKQPITTNMMK